VLVASGTAAGLACNLLSGVGDLQTRDDTADTGVVDALGDADVRDASPDGAVPPPTCACVSPPPADWGEPIALLEAPGPARACPAGLTAVLDGGTSPGAPSPCTPCTCAKPIGSCATATVETHAGAACAGNCGIRTIGATCGAVPYCAPGSSATATGNVDSGTCAPDGGVLAPASWANSASACAFSTPLETTCPPGKSCAPQSEGARDARTCILHAGDVACPPGPYAARVVYDAKIVDTRSCSTCGCDPPNGMCTSGTVSMYVDTTCGTATKDVPTSGACTSFGNPTPNGSAKITAQPQLIDGGCSPRGGQLADGGLTGTDPTTLCCL
jgi:hypothetical protein